MLRGASLNVSRRIVAGIALALEMGMGVAAAVPALKPALQQLRFSPDGRHLLAQDDSEVTVLAVEPLTVIFRIPVQDATPAQFTPDSRNIVFVSSAIRVDPQRIALPKSDAHVERWSIADHTRVESVTLPSLGCR